MPRVIYLWMALTSVAHGEQLLRVLALASAAHSLRRRKVQLKRRIRVDGFRDAVPASAGCDGRRDVNVVLEDKRLVRSPRSGETARSAQKSARCGAPESKGGEHSRRCCGDGGMWATLRTVAFSAVNVT